MTGTEVSAWVCVDCLILFANGDIPEELTESESESWLATIDRRTAGYHVAIGGEHDSDCPNIAEDGSWVGRSDCDCERLEFSWSECDTCGSFLGGERHAVTLFPLEVSS